MINFSQNFEKIMEIDENNEETDFIKIKVTAEMSREDVVDLILKTTSSKESQDQGSPPSSVSQPRLLDGYYKPIESLMHFWKINGENIEAEDFHNTYDFKPSIQYGDFGEVHLVFILFFSNTLYSGEASAEICEKIGKCNFNFLLKFYFAMGEVDESGKMKVKIRIP